MVADFRGGANAAEETFYFKIEAEIFTRGREQFGQRQDDFFVDGSWGLVKGSEAMRLRVATSERSLLISEYCLKRSTP